jgi:hypothetical protein
MPSSFSIRRAPFSNASDPALREEIRAHTASDEEASSILRCIERFGGDSSIRYYEMTPVTTQRTFREARPMAWSVRAVRP